MVLGSLGSGAIFALFGWWLAKRVGYATGLSFAGLLWWMTVIALVTMTPLQGVNLEIPSYAAQQSCSFDYGGPAPEGFWIFAGGQRLLNTVLFIPAGFLLMMSVVKWRASWLLAPLGLVLLAGCSVAIEFAQLEVARLDRACDVTDMVDNTIGAGIGVVLGALAALAVRVWRRWVSRRRSRPARQSRQG